MSLFQTIATRMILCLLFDSGAKAELRRSQIRTAFRHSMNPHIQRLIACIGQEEAEQVRQYRLGDTSSMRTLKAEGLVLHPIRVTRKTIGYLDYPEVSFRLPYPAETQRFRNGVPVECFRADEEPVKGLLLEMEGQTGSIRLFAPDFPEWLEEEGTGIKLSPDLRTTEIMRRKLTELENDRAAFSLFREIHEGWKNSHQRLHSNTASADFFNPSLNGSQRSAVERILENERLLVVHGPPGTGKTTTLTEGIRQLVASGEKVLACAPSNTAIDHLSRSLIAAGLPLLRVGNTGKVDEAVFPYTPEGRMSDGALRKEIKDLRIRAEEFRRMAMKYKRNFDRAEREQRSLLFKEVKSIRAEIKDRLRYHEARLFEEAAVIAGTPVGLHDSLPAGFRARTLVMDEAGQCLEPLAWCVLPMADRIVLAGDHLQLPPVVLSREAAAAGLGRSILETAVESGCPSTLLDVQYRMRPSIAAFPSDYFYEGRLQTAPHLTDQDVHVTFIDTAGSGFSEEPGAEGTSLSNPGELDIVRQLIEREGGTMGTIAFISPYSGQVSAARETLPRNLRIHTVDSFQGQEEETVIVSLVRSNDEGIIGFLKDHRRMNVAMTRAQNRLFVIGDSATVSRDAFYASFLEHVERNGAYRSVWEFEM